MQTDCHQIMKTKKIIKIAGIVLLVIAVCLLTVWLFPKVAKLADEAERQKFKSFIDSLGPWGVAVMLAIQIVQVVFAVIPGEPIEILAGFMYGTFGGLAICLAGVLIATAGIFFTIRALGHRYIEKMVNSEKYRKYRFLNDPVRLESLMFVLFVIPGTPKDLLTYFAPCTKIKPVRFLLIATLSRIPSVISSTYVGAKLSNGDFWISVIVFVATAVVGLAGIWINNRFLHRRQADSDASPAVPDDSVQTEEEIRDKPDTGGTDSAD